jgi:carbon storage regulator CsrA
VLIVTRSKGESITLIEKDGTITKITISTVKGGQVKLAVEAPLTVRVLRTEVHEAERGKLI